MRIGRPLEILEVELTPEEAPKPSLWSDPEAPVTPPERIAPEWEEPEDSA
jgi:hypothetical protein